MVRTYYYNVLIMNIDLKNRVKEKAKDVCIIQTVAQTLGQIY